MAKFWQLRTVGPTILSQYLHKRLEDDKEYGVNLLQDNDAGIKWLNGRLKGYVAYVSFGTVVTLEVEQMEELAWGLNRSNSNFLWVVRESEAAKVPKGGRGDIREELERASKKRFGLFGSTKRHGIKPSAMTF
ncbi:unnamed protein product [Malus baccata var. baccata]